jgi:tetratricopeptide (TPR) repeat protein
MSLKKHLDDLEIFRAANNEQGIANASFKIGDIYLAKGKWHEAEQYLSEAEAICRKLGNEDGRALTAIGLGDIYRNINEPKRAHHNYEQALDFFEKQGHEKMIANLMEKLGDLYRYQGELSQALQAFQRGRDICRNHSDDLGAAHFTERMALVYRSQELLEQAMSSFQEAITYYEVHRVPDRLAFVLTGLGDLYNRMDKPQAALDYLARALDIYQKLGARKPAELLTAEIAAIEGALANQEQSSDKR